jgi:hypothetical protein
MRKSLLAGSALLLSMSATQGMAQETSDTSTRALDAFRTVGAALSFKF